MEFATLLDPEKCYPKVRSASEPQLVSKMSYYNLQQDALAEHEEMRGLATMFDQRGTVICPKPRRVGVFPNMPTRPLRWQFCQQGEELQNFQDIIFKESNYGEELHANQLEASSPPFFHGSPPVRAANPLIQDEQFGYEKYHITPPQSTYAISSSPCLSSPSSSASSSLSSPSSSLRKGGCTVRMKYGAKSAAVKVVGFDCHVPAVA